MARVLLTHSPALVQPALDIALSERNLVVLLSKLYTPGSACAVTSGDVPIEFAHATYRAEPDELHYASHTRDGGGPGPMHPLAELVWVTVRHTVAEALLREDVWPVTLTGGGVGVDRAGDECGGPTPTRAFTPKGHG